MARAEDGKEAVMTPEPVEMVVETVPSSVARIRRFAVDACRTADSAVDGDTVALLVSEVATNALVHGAGEVRVRVLPRSPGVRIEVVDGSHAHPRRRHATTVDEGGRGIALVEALSTAWGSEATRAGKTVWFELDAG
jgi:anti-sigma regulatory factor (Ser/Thr protein kinase)